MEILKTPNCHPKRAYSAKGLCRPCYSRAWKHRKYGPPKYRHNPIKSYIVYLYVDLDKVPLYVGRGTIHRAKAHKYPYKHQSSWWRKDLLLVTMSCKDEWEAMEYEGKWGGYYHPIENKEGNREFVDRRKQGNELAIS